MTANALAGFWNRRSWEDEQIMMKPSLQTQTQRLMPPVTSFGSVRGGILQRTCTCGSSTAASGEYKERLKQRLSLQRKTLNSETGTQTAAKVPTTVPEVPCSPDHSMNLDTFVEVTGKNGRLTVKHDQPMFKKPI